MGKLHLSALGALVAMGLATQASAAPVLLTLAPLPFHFAAGQQANITGCIIAGTTCGSQTPGFAYTNFVQGGNIPSYDQFSPIYTAGQLVTQTGGVAFNVGIDTNTNNQSNETLRLFEVIDVATGSVLYNYIGAAGSNNIGDSMTLNNGNGWADFQLFTVNLTGLGLTAASQIKFHAVWDTANAGAESYFVYGGTGGTVINPQCTSGCAVPGPIAGVGLPAMSLLGGFFLLWRRRKHKVA